MKRILSLTVLAVLIVASASAAQLGSTTGTTTISVSVGAEAGLTVNTATTTLAEVGGNFTAYTGTTGLTYYVRTTQNTGSGSITLKVTTDFAPAGGPSIGSPPTAGDKLAYTCTVSAPGSACVGSVTSSTSASTSVGTFGADAHSVFAGNTASTSWTLTNDPAYKVGTYNATITYTISAS